MKHSNNMWQGANARDWKAVNYRAARLEYQLLICANDIIFDYNWERENKCGNLDYMDYSFLLNNYKGKNKIRTLGYNIL